MAAHSVLGASSMYRWSACPGSVREIAAHGVSTSSKYAEEGSDAHHLAAAVLEKKLDPATIVGLTIKNIDHDFVVDLQMADAVCGYAEAVLADMEHGDVLHVETRFDLGEVHPGCFGTADAVVWKPKAKTLIVSDFKYGAGIPVEAKDNPQLMYYGLGALLALNYPAERVVLQIIQPRCEHPQGVVRRHEMAAIDMLDFQGQLQRHAKATEDPKAPLVAGEHCRFCPAALGCPELQRRRNEVAALDFAAPPIAPEKLALALESVPLLEALAKRIKDVAYSEAQAGRVPPRHKIVERVGNRAWKNEANVVEFLGELGTKSEDLYHAPELKSPAQVEKLVGKGVIDAHVVRPVKGYALVPESDKRPAVRPSAALEFGSANS